jgi:hypothetical protein
MSTTQAMPEAITRRPVTPRPTTPDPDLQDAVLTAVSETLVRRGYLTTEFWTTVVGAALTSVLSVADVANPTATQIVAVATPAVLAAVYATVRSLHKSRFTGLITDLFPENTRSL